MFFFFFCANPLVFGRRALTSAQERGEFLFLLENPKRMVLFTPGYLFEGAGLDDDEVAESRPRSSAVIDQPWDLAGRDNDFEFYRVSFTGKEHWNFLGQEVIAAQGPMAVSIIRTGEYYTSLVRTTKGCERRETLCSLTQEGALDKLLRRGHTPKAVLRSVCPELLRDPHDLGAMELFPAASVPENAVPDLLLTLHDRQRVTGFKFGVLYAARLQCRESEFFSNTKTSPMFDEFLAFLGDKIELSGWEGFRGGLDVRAGSTGKYAVYTEYNPGNCPVLFHVSPFLPYDPNNEQQLERKRHIGNDLVVIVFQDSSEAPFRPAEISSRMIHVIILVRPVKFADRPDETWYRVAVISKNDTPVFAPVFENVTLFKKGKAFRDLLFQKLLNGERACYAAPILSKKMEKTRNVLLSDCIRQAKGGK